MTEPAPTSRTFGAEPNPLVDALSELVRRWRWLVAFPLALGVVAVLISFLVPRRYQAVTVFSPADDMSGAISGNLLSLASQFGIGLQSGGYSVYYFSQVTMSRAVLSRVAEDTVDVDGRATPVYALLGVDEEDPGMRLEQGIRGLQDWIDVGTDEQSNLVTLSVMGPSPEAAIALANALLQALNAVTTASIQRGGSAERRFSEAQADTAALQLRQAENALRDFYVANRSIQSSPALQAEESRLRRAVQVKQDIYMALTNQAESAKLREVRNTPSIAMVQPPLASAKKVWPRRSVWLLSAVIAGFLGAVGWLYFLAPLAQQAGLIRRPAS